MVSLLVSAEHLSIGTQRKLLELGDDEQKLILALNSFVVCSTLSTILVIIVACWGFFRQEKDIIGPLDRFLFFFCLSYTTASHSDRNLAHGRKKHWVVCNAKCTRRLSVRNRIGKPSSFS